MYSLFYSFLIYLSNMLSLLNVFYVSAKELSLQILHCITQYYAYQGIFWKPGKTSKGFDHLAHSRGGPGTFQGSQGVG